MERPGAGPEPAAARPRRARWGRRLALAALVLVLLVAALVALAPSLIGGLVGGYVERDFDARHQGSLELPALSLGWRARQAVEGARLFDPQGREVLTASVELPSLLELVAAARAYDAGQRLELGRVVVELEGEVVVGPDGTTNLERALAPEGAPTEPAPPPPAPPEPGPREPGPPPAPRPSPPADEDARALLELYERLGLRFELRASRLSYRDERTGAPPLALAGLEGALELRPGEPLVLGLRGRHELGAPGPFALELRASEPRAGQGGALDFGAVQLTLDVSNLPLEFLAERFGSPASADELRALLGERLELRAGLAGEGAYAERALELGLTAGQVRLDARGRVVDGRVESPPGAPLAELALTLPEGLVEGLTAPRLPKGARIETPEGGARLALSLAELSWPLAAEDPLGAARARVELALGPLAYTEPALEAAGERLAFERLELVARLAPGAAAEVELGGALDAAGTSRLAARLALPPGWSTAVAEGRAAELPLELELTAQGLSTKLIDALAGQEGLLVDVLGPSLSMRLGAQGLSTTGGRLDARLESQLGSLDWRASYADGALVAQQPDDRLVVSARLGPLLAERVIGPLVPLLVDVQKPADAGPLELTVSDFRLPLDGEVDALSARVSLALGRVSYRLLPGLAQQLPGEQALARRTLELPAYVVQVGDGLARYDDLPLTIDGRRFDWKGSFDLKARRFDLGVELPLSKLGGEVGKALEPVRGALSGDLAVPLRLRGTLTKPELSVEPGFLEGAARDAAQRALQKELEKGLGGDLQKKLKELLGRDGR